MADKHTLAEGPPTESRIDALNTATPKLADEPTLANGPPSGLRIDALNTATPNLADEPSLADGPPMHHGIYIMGCIWQPFWILQEKVGISFYF